MKKVEFVFFDAGGGHRSAATALKTVIEQQVRDWSVQLMNMQEDLDSLDIFRKITRVRFQDLYNKMLAKGWTLGSEYLLPPMHGIIRIFHRAQVRMLTEIWRAKQPDMVVSVVPNFNRALFQSLQKANPEIPFVTILTDMADYPPNFWLERQDHYVICGTERAYQQALATGKRPERTFLTSGMIVRPGFYEQFEHDRGSERRKIGLDPSKPVALMLFGGQGSNVMLKITKDLQEIGPDLQLIVICGRNAELADKLRRMPSRLPMHVVEFTSEIPYFMSLSDFFIGKPGPGSISEAVAMKLPVIVERNAWTLPQERYNADWVREKGVGIVVDNFSKIRKAASELLKPARLNELQQNVAKINNRAVFEIPDILQKILDRRA
ncbi:MAG TPA: glycosyltransferase [Bryobacteraceae bacterium]|nr:glycosyltransferase [Bryobacteraceae bacterium]